MKIMGEKALIKTLRWVQEQIKTLLLYSYCNDTRTHVNTNKFQSLQNITAPIHADNQHKPECFQWKPRSQTETLKP